ncbi:MAG: DUF4097 family beta strand repeat-containing protein [Acidobacteriota bacterium]|nr:DUF4097 family beta strand repeat-containing protein [Acidobacteriota bacterium]
MKTRVLFAAIVLGLSGVAVAQQQQAPRKQQQSPMLRKTMRSIHKFSIAPGGAFVLDNPIGNIELAGADVTEVEATILTVLTAVNAAALDEAEKQSGIITGGDLRTRVVRTAVAAYVEKKPWTATVNWNVRVPRGTTVRIISNASDRINVSELTANLYIKNFNGSINLSNVNGPVFAESVNGSIVYSTPQPRGNVVLATLNGQVTATVASTSDLRWVAETATGDIRTNLPARGAFFGPTFRGSVNAPGGPTITTTSLMGDVYLLASGAAATPWSSVRNNPNEIRAPIRAVNQPMTSGVGPRVFSQRLVRGVFTYETNVGDVKVAEVRGDATVNTGAGEVQLGSVTGSANVHSDGGPLELGEVFGTVTASTRAGDILIDSTRRGGTISTQGGTIRLLYTSGPTRLSSGGGDITVRQAAAPVTAETTSGDIMITMDPAQKTETVNAKTAKGNVVLTVDPGFAADIDATILTSDPNADTILSDIPGLSISRTQATGKTRVHATGKINGGGEKVTLQATDGDIRIVAGRVGTTLVKTR